MQQVIKREQPTCLPEACAEHMNGPVPCSPLTADDAFAAWVLGYGYAAGLCGLPSPWQATTRRDLKPANA
jgi:hypothetical protein